MPTRLGVCGFPRPAYGSAIPKAVSVPFVPSGRDAFTVNFAEVALMHTHPAWLALHWRDVGREYVRHLDDAKRRFGGNG